MIDTRLITITDFSNLSFLKEIIETKEPLCLKIKDSLTEITQDEFMSLLSIILTKASNILCSKEMIAPYLYLVPSLISVESSNYYYRLLSESTVESGELRGVSNSVNTLNSGYYWIPKNVSIIYREHSMSCYNFIYEVLTEYEYYAEFNSYTTYFN